MGVTLIFVALWIIFVSRGKGRGKEVQAEDPVGAYKDTPKPEAVNGSTAISQLPKVEEFNPYPGPNDSQN